MVKAITEWAQATIAANVVAQIPFDISLEKERLARVRSQNKVIRRAVEDMRAAMQGSDSKVLDKAYQRILKLQYNFESVEPHPAKPTDTVGVQRFLLGIVWLLDGREKAALENLANTKSRGEEAKKYLRPGVDYRGVERFRIDPTGWRYDSPKLRQALKEEHTAINVMLANLPHGVDGSWSPETETLKIPAYHSPEEIKPSVIRHELQHMTQTLLGPLLEVKGLVGLPSKAIRTPQWKQPDGLSSWENAGHAQSEPSVLEKYLLDDEEFYTLLTDAIEKAEADMSHATPAAQKEFLLEKLGLSGAPSKMGKLFLVWKKHAPGKYRKAVSEFYRAFPVLAQSNAAKRVAVRAAAKGDCFEAAGKWIMANDLGTNARVVHGEVTGQGALEGVKFGHAWIEIGETVLEVANGNNLKLPKAVYYAIGNIGANVHRYTREQALVRMLKFKHYGPWELKTETGL